MDAADQQIGYEQARRLRTTMEAVGIDREELWLYYFGLGGMVSEFELDAYLNHSMLLPPLQRDLLAQAANEIVAERTPPVAPFTSDLQTLDQAGEQSAAREDTPPAHEDAQADHEE